jgi:hypothetical protein
MTNQTDKFKAPMKSAVMEALGDLGIQRIIDPNCNRSRDLFQKMDETIEEEENKNNKPSRAQDILTACIISHIAAATQLTPNQIIEIYPAAKSAGGVDVKSIIADFDSGKGVATIKEKHQKLEQDETDTDSVNHEGIDPNEHPHFSSFVDMILAEREAGNKRGPTNLAA